MDVFSLGKDKLTDDLEYNTIPEWDSIGHMTLISELEDIFNISLETEDIINFSTFKIGIDILKKYGVEFD